MHVAVKKHIKVEHFSHLASIVLLLSKRNELHPKVKMWYRELQKKLKPLLEQIQKAKSLREEIQEAYQILEEIQEDEDQTNDCFNPLPPLPSIEEVAEESGEVKWTPNQMTITVEEKPLGTSWMVAKDDTIMVQEDEDQSNERFHPTAPSLSSIEEVAEESGEVQWTLEEIQNWLLTNRMTITVQPLSWYLKDNGEMTNKEPIQEVRYPRKVNKFRPLKWIKKMFGKSNKSKLPTMFQSYSPYPY